VWDVEVTDQFEQWWDTLGVEEQESIEAAVELLEQRGPGLGRPLVDTVKGSRHANIKELRVAMIRVLFAFNPTRTAILLIGGDKRDRWQEFYAQMIPLADTPSMSTSKSLKAKEPRWPPKPKASTSCASGPADAIPNGVRTSPSTGARWKTRSR